MRVCAGGAAPPCRTQVENDLVEQGTAVCQAAGVPAGRAYYAVAVSENIASVRRRPVPCRRLSRK